MLGEGGKAGFVCLAPFCIQNETAGTTISYVLLAALIKSDYNNNAEEKDLYK